jgi:hypothetical protein
MKGLDLGSGGDQSAASMGRPLLCRNSSVSTGRQCLDQCQINLTMRPGMMGVGQSTFTAATLTMHTVSHCTAVPVRSSTKTKQELWHFLDITGAVAPSDAEK